MEALFSGQNWANGLMLGALYAVAGVGFALVWGVLNVINVAQGSMIVGGAYVTYLLYKHTGLDPYLSLPISAAVLFCFGYLLQRYVINLIVRAPMFMTLLLTFGVDLVLTVLLLTAFQATPRQVNPGYSRNSVHALGMVLPVTRLAAFGIAVGVTALVWLVLTRTRLGARIRAASMDVQAAQLVGIRIAGVYAITFAIASALAGIAGTLLSTTQSFSPIDGPALTLKAFVVVALGGLGSAWAALAGGLLLGLAEVLGGAWLGVGYSSMISFAILIAVLLVRPSGLLGRQSFAS
jgi:branched-chain amino acid transport system permease protein